MRRESAGHVLQTSALIAESSFGGYTGISKLKPALDLLSMVRPIAASRSLGWGSMTEFRPLKHKVPHQNPPRRLLQDSLLSIVAHTLALHTKAAGRWRQEHEMRRVQIENLDR